MKKYILIILLYTTIFQLIAESNIYDLDNVSIKSIIDYYELLDKKDLQKAYEKSNKTIDFDVYKSWYDSLKDIHILDIETLGDGKYKIDLVMVENDINTVYRYNVIFTMNNKQIINSILTDVSNTVNSSSTYSLISGREFRHNEYSFINRDVISFKTKMTGDVSKNLYVFTYNMGDSPGYYFVIDNKIFLKNNHAIKDSVLNFMADKNMLDDTMLLFNKNTKSLISQSNLEHKTTGEFFWSDLRPIVGSIIKYKEYDISIVDNDLYDYDILGSIYKNPGHNDITIRISLLNTSRFVTYRSLEKSITRFVLGYTYVDNKKYYLIAASHIDRYDEVFFSKYYTDDRELQKFGYFFGWIPEKNIILK